MSAVNQVAPREGVQSVQRALDLMETVARRGGQLAIGEIAAASQLPLPTIHRLLRTLVDRGYMRQLPDRRYALGFRLVPLGLASSALVGAHVRPVLEDLVDRLGESANVAILSEDQAEYVAQVPSRHTMRIFTEVGRRVDLHCTGVGKALLSQLADAQVAEVVARRGLPARTEHTLTTERDLLAALSRVRAGGFAVDEQEQEMGVRCVAVPVPTGPAGSMALSISGPVTRMTEDLVRRAVPLLLAGANVLAHDLPRNPIPYGVPSQPRDTKVTRP